MDSGYVLLIIGMGLVTFLPRAIPLTVLQGIKFPPFLQEVLKNVPYAILGALIFPGIFFIDGENVLLGIIGALGAFALAFSGVNVIVVVIGSIILLSAVSALI
ncbi:AzlD domain-containing protein [Caldibacillus debilis]|uniref:AzlD domain-containing protein n=1 Tax=Caldibacillus debilis TaxID=301148 RepID=UPI002FD951D7